MDDIFSKIKEPPEGGSTYVKWNEVGQELLIDPISNVEQRQASFRDEITTLITGKNAETGRLCKLDCATADLKEMAIVENLQPGGRLALRYLRNEDTGGPQLRKRIAWHYEPPADGEGGTSASEDANKPTGGDDTNYVEQSKSGTRL